MGHCPWLFLELVSWIVSIGHPDPMSWMSFSYGPRPKTASKELLSVLVSKTMSSVNTTLLSEALELLLQVELATSFVSSKTFTKDQDAHHICPNTSVICCTIINTFNHLTEAATLENMRESSSSSRSPSSSDEEVRFHIVNTLFLC